MKSAKQTQKRIFSVLLCLILCLGLLPGMARAAEGITVYVSVSDQGSFALTDEGNPAARLLLTVPEGTTVEEAARLAHAQYCPAGADGWETQDTQYGLTMTKIWGKTEGVGSYYVNGTMPLVSVRDYVLENWDYLDLILYRDDWSDSYARFDSRLLIRAVDNDFVLTLTYDVYDDSYNVFPTPLAGAVIKLLDGTPLGVTDTEGMISLSFSAPGQYLITAESEVTAITAPFCRVTVFEPAEGWISAGTCGENLIWELNGDGVLTVSGIGEMGAMWSNNANSQPWQYWRDEIKSVYVDSGVTSIGYSAFADLPELTKVTLPDTLKTIEDWAFENCVNLSEITLPDGLEVIGEGAFAQCESLNALVLPEGLKAIGSWCFQNCSGLETLIIPASVETIGDRAFLLTSALQSIQVDVNNPYFCSQDAVLFNLDKTKLMAYPIGNAQTAYTVPDGVTSIASCAFENSTLESVSLSQSIRIIEDYAFLDCAHLSAIHLNEGLERIGLSAFYDCEALQNVTLPDSLREIGEYAFYGCKAFTSITIPDGISTIPQSAFAYCIGLTEVSIPDTVTAIGAYAFYDCDAITAVTIPANVTEFGEEAFYDCDALTTVTLAEGLTSIGDYAFYNCDALTDVALPASMIAFGMGAFANCASLTSILAAEDNPVYVSQDGILFNKSITRIIQYPAGKTALTYEIPETVTVIGEECFNGNENLNAIIIPSGVTEIGAYAFQECTGLKRIGIPANVMVIGEDVFYDCDDTLKDVYYAGSEERWAQIDLDEENDCLLAATIHYNSSVPVEQEPYIPYYPVEYVQPTPEPETVTTTVTNEDGSTETTSTAPDGSTATVKADAEGNITEARAEITAEAVAAAEESPITLNLEFTAARESAEAPELSITIPEEAGSVTVEIPVKDVSSTSVVVLVHEDGTEEVLPKTAMTEDGVAITVSGNVTVKIVDNEKEFGDVEEDYWGSEAIDYVTSRELFQGTGEDTFDPELTMTRAMIVTVLYRMESKPETEGGAAFTDVPEGQWYSEAVAWASSSGIVTGYGDTFGKDDPVTREQLVLMLYRLAGEPETEPVETGAHPWAAKAMSWAVSIGLIQGDGESYNATDTATRAETATLLMRYING